MVLKVTQKTMTAYLEKTNGLMYGFLALLRYHSFMKVSEQPGMTWVELFFLSLAHMEDPLSFLFPMNAESRPSFDRQLAGFRLNANSLTDMLWGHPTMKA